MDFAPLGFPLSQEDLARAWHLHIMGAPEEAAGGAAEPLAAQRLMLDVGANVGKYALLPRVRRPAPLPCGVSLRADGS